MEIATLKDFVVPKDSFVKCTECGNIVELMYMDHKSNGNNIKKISKDLYLDKSTGEVKEYQHTITRAQSPNELRKTFKRIRDLVNCNTADVSKCKWVTLTYRENMQNPKVLYKDVEKFIKKLRRRLGKFEYINVAEPQGRGAWHMHCILIFNKKAPYFSNKKMEEVWGHGYTDTQNLKDNDNIGAYLSAYLGDIELNSYTYKIYKSHNSGKQYMDIREDKKGKRYIKGGRLYFYPSGFNIVRPSRGIKRPTVSLLHSSLAEKKVQALTCTFEKTISLTDIEKDYFNTINYRYYNTKRFK